MSNPNQTPQKSFDVHFTRMVSQSTVVRVLAADRRSATVQAWEKLNNVASKLDWEDGDLDGTVEQADIQEVELVDESTSFLLPHAKPDGSDVIEIIQKSRFVLAYLREAMSDAHQSRLITNFVDVATMPAACLLQAYQDCQRFILENEANIHLRICVFGLDCMPVLGDNFYHVRNKGFVNIGPRFGIDEIGKELRESALVFGPSMLKTNAAGEFYFASPVVESEESMVHSAPANAP
jgi:hypothetical protein